MPHCALMLDAELCLDSVFGCSVFPQVDDLLGETRYQKALEFIPQTSNIEYRSTVDLLLCELLPHYQEPCLLFYEDSGLPLRKTISPPHRNYLERYLLQAMELALSLYDKQEELSWASLGSATNAQEFTGIQSVVNVRDSPENTRKWLRWQEVQFRHPDLRIFEVWCRL